MSQKGNINEVGWFGGDCGRLDTTCLPIKQAVKNNHKGMSTRVAMPSDFLTNPDLYMNSPDF